jgi:hypothetical protein
MLSCFRCSISTYLTGQAPPSTQSGSTSLNSQKIETTKGMYKQLNQASLWHTPTKNFSHVTHQRNKANCKRNKVLPPNYWQEHDWGLVCFNLQPHISSQLQYQEDSGLLGSLWPIWQLIRFKIQWTGMIQVTRLI